MNRARVSASFRSERQFGFLLGAICILLASWWLNTGKWTISTYALLAAGVALFLLALFAPAKLTWPNAVWMAVARLLSKIMTPVILGLVYFLLITPIGFLKRLTGWDPLGRRGGAKNSYWKPYSEHQQNPRHYDRMF